MSRNEWEYLRQHFLNDSGMSLSIMKPVVSENHLIVRLREKVKKESSFLSFKMNIAEFK